MLSKKWIIALAGIMLLLTSCSKDKSELPHVSGMKIVTISAESKLRIYSPETNETTETTLSGPCSLISGWKNGARDWYLIEETQNHQHLQDSLHQTMLSTAKDLEFLTTDGSQTLAQHIQWHGEIDYDTERTYILLKIEQDGESTPLRTGVIDAVISAGGKIAAETEDGHFFILYPDGTVSEEQIGRPIGWRSEAELVVLRDTGAYKNMHFQVWLYSTKDAFLQPLQDVHGETVCLRHFPGRYITVNETWLAYTAHESSQYPVVLSLIDGRTYEMKTLSIPLEWQLYIHLP